MILIIKPVAVGTSVASAATSLSCPQTLWGQHHGEESKYLCQDHRTRGHPAGIDGRPCGRRAPSGTNCQPERPRNLRTQHKAPSERCRGFSPDVGVPCPGHAGATGRSRQSPVESSRPPGHFACRCHHRQSGQDRQPLGHRLQTDRRRRDYPNEGDHPPVQGVRYRQRRPWSRKPTLRWTRLPPLSPRTPKTPG